MGDGTSESTLSVATSTIGSSASTVSPTFLSHAETVPSVTDSPSAGILMDCAISILFLFVSLVVCVQRLAGKSHCGFANRLILCWVCVNELRNVFRIGFPSDNQLTLTDLLGYA